MAKCIGLDIGSQNGFASLLENDDSNIVMDLVPSRYMDGIPTTAYIEPPEGNHIVVFENETPAESSYAKKGARYLIRSVKRILNRSTISIKGMNKPVSTEEIYSAIARDQIIEANRILVSNGHEPVYSIVFTFPASYADDPSLLDKMEKSIEKVSIDGHSVKVAGRLPEPAAAAIDYLHYIQKEVMESARIERDSYTVLIYDLGHGTFDTAVVTAQTKQGEAPYILHNKAGIPDVGGQDFDEVLISEIYRILKEKYQYKPKSFSVKEEIRKTAIEMKYDLSDVLQGEKSLHKIFNEDGEYYDIEITRERFEQLSKHLLHKTLSLVYQCKENAKKAGIEIDQVICTGGASKMPMVKKGLEELFEHQTNVTIFRPSKSVSYGASRYALQIEEPKEEVKQNKETKKEPVKVTKVMDQLTDCCYGIRQMTGNLEDEVVYLIQPKQKRPASSKPISLVFSSSHIRVWLYRSLKDNENLSKGIPETDAKSLQQIWFDITPGKCEIRITALENYDMEVEMKDSTGKIQRKKTSDGLN